MRTFFATLLATSLMMLPASATFAMVDYDGMIIQNLPDHGAVTITGEVDSVLSSDTFVLKDRHNDRITVKTEDSLEVSEGDKVIVSGDIQVAPNQKVELILAKKIETEQSKKS